MGNVYATLLYVATGKFSFLRLRLEQISKYSRTKDILIREEQDAVYNYVCDIVQQHQYCLNFIESVNNLASRLIFNGIFCLIIGMSITGCLMVTALEQDVNFAIKMGCIYFLYMEGLFVASYPCRKVLDASQSLCGKSYCTEWYEYSIETRKILQMMILRASNGSSIAIGSSAYLNYQTTGTIIRLSMSYVTTLASIIRKPALHILGLILGMY